MLNNQLCSTDALCAKVAKAEPAPIQVLSQLITEFKERFATNLWDPLSASSEFSKKLGAVQSDVQGLLYSHIQTFNRELEEIRNQFDTLLSLTPPPMFDISVERNQQNDPIYESFQKLYRWTFEGFHTVVTDCQHKKQSGVQWRDPDNERRGWKKLKAEVEVELRKTEVNLDFEAVQRIGPKILLMQRGFTETILGLHENPDDPPDFKKLEQLFGEGKIQIRVESKKPKGN